MGYILEEMVTTIVYLSSHGGSVLRGWSEEQGERDTSSFFLHLARLPLPPSIGKLDSMPLAKLKEAEQAIERVGSELRDRSLITGGRAFVLRSQFMFW